MRIAYIYDVIYPDTIGGVERRIYELGIRLHEKGHEIHLYGMKFWNGPDSITRDGLIIHGVCPKTDLYTDGRRSIWQAIRYAIGLTRHLIRSDAEIMDCQNFPYFPAIITFLISKMQGKKMIVTWHEFWGEYWYTYLGRIGLFGVIIEKITLLCSQSILAVSPLTANRIKDAGYSEPILISPNGITLSSISTVPRSEKKSDIIFLGRFIPEKHPELVVEALRLLADEKIFLKCIMIGDGPDLENIKSLIQKYEMSDIIECTGFIKDYSEVIALMKASRIFLLPSEREGFGIAAIEAMACGLALITIDHPRNAAAAHVLPGNGYLSSMSISDITNGIKICLSQPRDMDAVSRYILSHCWDQIVDDLEIYYTSVLN